MAIARFKDLCIDTGKSEKLGRFWAAGLGLRFEPDGEAGVLRGASSEQTIWMNVVPESKTVKHRVHLDVHAESVDAWARLGAKVLEPADEYGRGWTVMADPEGGEFCVFVREPASLPAYRLYEVVVDCADPRPVARFWAEVYGATLGGDDDKGWWLEDVPGLPFDGWSFVPVPEPKTVKNRVHWDVTVATGAGLDELVGAGATMLRARDDEIRWNVMSDPEGNEFCAFVG